MTPDWGNSPADLSLPEGEVHVWHADLTTGIKPDYLSTDEQDRLERFHFPDGQRRFGASHSLLRRLLGRYLDLEPDEFELEIGPNGKPHLSASLASSRLHFNLAHSADLALLAFCRSHEIGVDLEQIHPMENIDQIARRWFTAGEQARLAALDEESKQLAFFTCWTCKEACLKCLGDGLAHGLQRFEVDSTPGQRARLLNLDGDRQAAAHWFLHCFPVEAGFLGAVAVQGQPEFNTHFYSWST